MSVELRSGVAVYRAGGVMLELRGDKLPGRFGGMVAANAGLRVLFQLVQSDVDGLAVRLPHPVVAADKRGQRDGLRRGKGSVPSGAMLNRCNGSSVRHLILMGVAVLDKLFGGVRMLAFTQTRKLFCADGSGEAELP